MKQSEKLFERLDQESLDRGDEVRVVGNHSGYGYAGSENFEHDDTGALHNYSGVEDDVFTAHADNDGWSEGYDY
ncbi:hypothetical protein [Marinobacterium sedimentorum]|uniref:hypothetical protein n=1 Tax=Marinobacterium sedimentorum TaxID=2927804 RepID=UPI0020C6AA7F|nr:hypothetical protein [Marinobacterium sedimentorum]MCP8687134.1 hypothetical protein [Marinobacterium sedimentorum]